MKRIGLTLIATLLLVQASLGADGNWLTDLSKAKTIAKQEKKLVLIDFTGSDWCPPCIALHKNVLTAKEFVDYAKDNLALVVIDFPRKKPLPAAQQKSNDALAKQFKVSAFPTLVVLDDNGKELYRTEGYNSEETVAEFVANLKSLKKAG